MKQEQNILKKKNALLVYWLEYLASNEKERVQFPHRAFNMLVWWNGIHGCLKSICESIRVRISLPALKYICIFSIMASISDFQSEDASSILVRCF